MKTEKKDCPVCGVECTSNNIQDGCYQYYHCGHPFEGPVTDIADMTIGDSVNYND